MEHLEAYFNSDLSPLKTKGTRDDKKQNGDGEGDGEDEESSSGTATPIIGGMPLDAELHYTRETMPFLLSRRFCQGRASPPPAPSVVSECNRMIENLLDYQDVASETQSQAHAYDSEYEDPYNLEREETPAVDPELDRVRTIVGTLVNSEFRDMHTLAKVALWDDAHMEEMLVSTARLWC